MTRRYLPGSNVVANRMDGKQSNITRTSNMFNNLFPLYFFLRYHQEKNTSEHFSFVCRYLHCYSLLFFSSFLLFSALSFFLSIFYFIYIIFCVFLVVFLPSFNTLACTRSHLYIFFSNRSIHIVQPLCSVFSTFSHFPLFFPFNVQDFFPLC